MLLNNDSIIVGADDDNDANMMAIQMVTVVKGEFVLLMFLLEML